MDRLDWAKMMVLKAFDSYVESMMFAAPELRDLHVNQFQLKVVNIFRKARQETPET